MSGLNANETRMLEERMQKTQLKQMTLAFTEMVDGCFRACVDDFTSKSLSSRETSCLTRCVEKTQAAQRRMGERFQEHNEEMGQRMQQG